LSQDPTQCLGNLHIVSGISFATTEYREFSLSLTVSREPTQCLGNEFSATKSRDSTRCLLSFCTCNKRTFSITSSAYTHTTVCRRSTYLHQGRSNLLLPLPSRAGFLLVAADRGNDAHKAKVGKDPREQNSKAKKRAELREKLQAAREEGQRRQHRCDHACVAVV